MDERFLSLSPDVLIFTHCHRDHYDRETVSGYLGRGGNILVLSPYTTWQKVRLLGGDHNYVMFNRGTTWSYEGFLFRAAVVRC